MPEREQITDRGYTGHKENRDLGLTFMNARYYAPELRRFASADPLVGGNRFAYVGNNPIMFSDPSGFCATSGTVIDMDDDGVPLADSRDLENEGECWAIFDDLREDYGILDWTPHYDYANAAEAGGSDDPHLYEGGSCNVWGTRCVKYKAIKCRREFCYKDTTSRKYITADGYLLYLFTGKNKIKCSRCENGTYKQ
ncbi:MAG: RHS repeat-associated core domain-containing protein, partial [Methylococcales bacterium]|nr:RHS repeat-associated core domain-containing protein [Methylococcales bacterium]